MRQPATVSSALFQTLDTSLGSVARIRLLRELALHGGGLPASLLAQRTGLSGQGVRNALRELEAGGLIVPIGPGRSPPFTLERTHPLNAPLVALFRAEAARADHLADLVRQTAEELDPPPLAVWLYGSAARHEDTASSDVDLAVVATGDVIQPAVDRLQDVIATRLSDPALVVSVVGLRPEDLYALIRRDPGAWERIRRDAVVLFGSPPGVLAHGP